MKGKGKTAKDSKTRSRIGIGMPLCVNQAPPIKKTRSGLPLDIARLAKRQNNANGCKTSEHQEQALLFEWAKWNEGRYPELKWLFAIPNGAKLPWRKNKYGQRYSAEANRLKAEGLKAGVFDVMLPVAMGGWHGLFIEMKIKPNKLTPEQEAFRDFIDGQEYRQVVCYSMEEAKYEILQYLWWNVLKARFKECRQIHGVKGEKV